LGKKGELKGEKKSLCVEYKGLRSGEMRGGGGMETRDMITKRVRGRGGGLIVGRKMIPDQAEKNRTLVCAGSVGAMRPFDEWVEKNGSGAGSWRSGKVKNKIRGRGPNSLAVIRVLGKTGVGWDQSDSISKWKEKKKGYQEKKKNTGEIAEHSGS